MNKELLKEIHRIKKLGKIPDLESSKTIENIQLNEGLLDDISNFLSKASDKISQLPAVKKLKGFYDIVKNKVSPTGGSVSSVSDVDSTFKNITNEIINKIEGGYYHPSFQQKGAKNVKGSYMPPSSFTPMGRSGETMFGIDRVHGGRINTSGFGSQFWSIIDNAQRTEGRWAYGYRGGPYENQLRDLASKIMYDVYKSNVDKYLSPESKKIVETNKDLLFQFSYASWNGPRYFQKFANALNKEVKEGNRDVHDLYDVVMDARQSSGQSNKKIAKIDRVIQNYA